MTVFVVVGGAVRAAHRYRELAEAELAPHGQLVWIDWVDAAATPSPAAEAQLDDALAGADAVVAIPWLGASWLTMPRFDAARLERAPGLRAIAGTFDHRFAWLDVVAAERRGVTLVDTSRTMTPTVAEFGLAMTLNLLRRIPESIELVRRGGWRTETPDGEGFVYGDLTGRRVGLAGYGSINRRYRELLGPFACDTAVCDPFVADDVLARDGLRRADSLVELAAASEILVIGIPPTPATQGVIDRHVLEALPHGALLVLLTRMAVVEQEPLWRRLRDGGLRAAIDVFDPEPPPTDAWFRDHPNVLATPHLAGNSLHAYQRCFTTACADAVALAAGAAPRHAVTLRDVRLYEGRPAG